MRILTRYVVKELLLTFVMTLTGMTMFMLLVAVVTEAVRKGLGLLPVLQLMPYLLPEAMRYSIPATSLLAACNTYGRLSSDNELIAVKSLGISPMRLIAPGMVLAFGISLFTIWVNDVAISWGRPGISQVVVESIENIAYGMLRTQRSYHGDRFSINVKSVEGRRLIRPMMVIQGNAESGTITLTAREAEMRRNPEDDSLSIFLWEGIIEAEGKAEMAFTGVYEHVISLRGDEESSSRSPSDFSLSALPQQKQQQQREIIGSERKMASLAAFEMLTGNFASLTGEAWDGRHAGRADARYRLNRLITEPWRRWANGFSCLFFVIVGAALSIRMRNSDFVTSFFMAFLPILVVYYPLMSYGVDRAKNGTMPPYTVWLGNIICLGIGLWLLRRVQRY